MPLGQNDKTQIVESSVAELGGGWGVAVGRLLRIFTDVRAFSAKAPEQHSDTVFPCVFTSFAGSCWEDIPPHAKRAVHAFQLLAWGLPQ